jgi:hypothetical protein
MLKVPGAIVGDVPSKSQRDENIAYLEMKLSPIISRISTKQTCWISDIICQKCKSSIRKQFKRSLYSLLVIIRKKYTIKR